MNQLKVFSIQFSKASIELRQQIIFQVEELGKCYDSFKQHNPLVKEFILISTCNRSDIYLYSQKDISLDELKEDLYIWIEFYFNIKKKQISPILNIYEHRQAFEFILKVCSGMDSMLVGEAQIFGQVKNAVIKAQKYQTFGVNLQKIFNLVYRYTKKIRFDTGISNHGLTIAYGVILVAKQIFENLSNLKVVLIGAGNIMHSLCYYLASNDIKNISVINRNIENARSLAKKFDFEYGSIQDIKHYIKQANIIVSSTASKDYIINLPLYESVKNISDFVLLVDLAVPCDIDPRINQLEQTYVYNIDDLQKLIDVNLNKKQDSIKQANQIIKQASSEFNYYQLIYEQTDFLKEYKLQLEQYKNKNVLKLLNCIEQQTNSDQVELEKGVNQILSEIIDFLNFDNFIQIRKQIKKASQGLDEKLISKEIMGQIFKNTPYKRLMHKNKKHNYK